MMITNEQTNKQNTASLMTDLQLSWTQLEVAQC